MGSAWGMGHDFSSWQKIRNKQFLVVGVLKIVWWGDTPASNTWVWSFSWGVARWTSPLGNAQKAIVTVLVAPAMWKKGWPKNCLRKGELFALNLLLQHCWCQYNICLRLLRRSYKGEAKRGSEVSWQPKMSIFAKPPLQKCSCERLCSPRPQRSLPVPVTIGLL